MTRPGHDFPRSDQNAATKNSILAYQLGCPNCIHQMLADSLHGRSALKDRSNKRGAINVGPRKCAKRAQ